MTPQEVAFRAWCDVWYRDHYGEEASVCLYTERHDQKQRGDVRVVASGTTHNYDEKCYLTVWNGCLVELLQESTPNGDTLYPISLGWFYELTGCHYLLCGFYDGDVLAEVYRISMRRLRAHYRDMMMATTPWKARAVVSREGWGITVAVVIPWELMKQYQCAECVYKAAPTTHDKVAVTAEQIQW